MPEKVATFLAASMIIFSTASPSLAGPKTMDEYKLQDAGTLLLSTASNGYQGDPTICIRRVDTGDFMMVSAARRSFWAGVYDTDFTEPPIGVETSPILDSMGFVLHYAQDPFAGRIKTVSLKPGDYEIYRIASGPFIPCNPKYKQYSGVSLRSSFEPDFSAPFTIKAGATTYVGEFKSLTVMGKNALMRVQMRAGFRFVLSDQHTRDIEIAKGKGRAAGEVLISVPNAATLHSRVLAAEP